MEKSACEFNTRKNVMGVLLLIVEEHSHLVRFRSHCFAQVLPKHWIYNPHSLTLNSPWALGKELLDKGVPWNYTPPKPKLLSRLLDVLYKWMVKPHCWRQYTYIHTYITQWIQKTQAGVYPEPSLLLASVHGTIRYSAYYHRRKVNINAATKPSVYNGDIFARSIGTLAVQKLCK